MTHPKQYQRDGVRLTALAVATLQELATLAPDEWKALPHVSRRALTALWKRDLVDRSFITGEATYKLSYRGRELLKQVNRPTYRRDGLCPHCGERPVAYTTTGKRRGYCQECLRAKQPKTNNYNPHTPCPCGNPRHVTASGRVYQYCQRCLSELDQVVRANRLARATASAEPRLCSHCGQRPCHITAKHAYLWCHDCIKARRAVYYHRSKFKKIVKLQGASK